MPSDIRRNTARLGALYSCVAAAAVTLPVTSQAAGEDPAQLEEVVVTAMKRGNEAVQDVPASIEVLTSERLENLGVREFADFARSVSGLSFVDEGSGNKRYVIRGINSAGEAQTALYYDNIPVTGLGGTASDFGGAQPDLALYDVQQIEVLRGPQGTLYGSNSQSGVIRIVTKKPNLTQLEGTAGFDVSTTRDGGTNYAVQGVLNAPIVTDTFGVRLLAYRMDNDGFIDNPLRYESNMNEDTTTGARLSALWKIGPNTSLLGQILYQHLDSGGRPIEQPFDATIIVNTYPAQGERRAALYTPEKHDDKSKVYALTLEHDFGWSDLTWSASRYDRDITDVQDYSVSFDFFRFLQGIGELPPVAIPAGGANTAPQSAKLTTSEIRLNTKLAGPVNGVGGFYWSDRKIDYLNDVTGTNFATGIPSETEGRVSSRSLEDKTRDLAVFGEVAWTATDRITLTGGARHFRTTRDLNAVTLYPFFGLGTPGAEPPQHSKNTDTIYKAVASFHVTKNFLTYMEYAEGYRAGGTNASTIAAVPPQYEPDTTSNYEVGAKTSWLNNALTLNVAAYKIDLKNLQTNQLFGPGGAFSGVGNVSGTVARSTGGELDITAHPIRNLELTATASYTNAKLVKDVPDLGEAAVNGAALLGVPKVGYSLAADYSLPLSAGRSATAGANLQHVGRVEHTRYDEYDLPLPAYTLVNIYTGIKWANYDATLYVNNLFDKNAELNVFYDVNDPIRVLTNRPRTIGVKFAAHW